MRVCIIGTGYVGLVTGACLAHIGHAVVCVDNDAAKVACMQSGKAPIVEPGLEEIMVGAMQAGQLAFTTDISAGVRHAEVIFIAVGTPALPSGESDTRAVEAVARAIGRHLTDRYTVIVNKSTVPIGSGDWVRMLISESAAAQANFDVVSNPEFLREGSAVFDTFHPDRIVLGGRSERAMALMQQLYAPIVQRQFATDTGLPPVPVMITDLASAEMIKYAANAFLATKISFINEVANICDRVGADVQQVAQGIGLDSRIGSKFLQAGLGWGGSCFPKDVSALVQTACDYGYEAALLKAVVTVNRAQRYLAIEKLRSMLGILKGKTIGLLGLTFKPDTDDLRDAPAFALARECQRLGARVKAYDPTVRSEQPPAGLAATVVDSPLQLAAGCDALVLVTEWAAFRCLDFTDLARVMTRPLIVDGRNFLDPQALAAAGFTWVGIGRPIAPAEGQAPQPAAALLALAH